MMTIKAYVFLVCTLVYSTTKKDNLLQGTYYVTEDLESDKIHKVRTQT
jgi:hypothetical protein